MPTSTWEEMNPGARRSGNSGQANAPVHFRDEHPAAFEVSGLRTNKFESDTGKEQGHHILQFVNPHGTQGFEREVTPESDSADLTASTTDHLFERCITPESESELYYLPKHMTHYEEPETETEPHRFGGIWANHAKAADQVVDAQKASYPGSGRGLDSVYLPLGSLIPAAPASTTSSTSQLQEMIRAMQNCTLPEGCSLIPPTTEWNKVTTVMLKNLPNKYTQQQLREEIDSLGFAGCYDFFYLPVDAKTNANKGYAFMNFVTTDYALLFRWQFDGRKMNFFNSQKVVSVVPAALQGLEKNYAHYSNTRVNRGHPDLRPWFSQQPNMYANFVPRTRPAEDAHLRNRQQENFKQQEMPHLPPPSSYASRRECSANEDFGEQPLGVSPQQMIKKPTLVEEDFRFPKFCPQCGTRSRPEYRFCTSCGERLPRMPSAAGYDPPRVPSMVCQ